MSESVVPTVNADNVVNAPDPIVKGENEQPKSGNFQAATLSILLVLRCIVNVLYSGEFTRNHKIWP